MKNCEYWQQQASRYLDGDLSPEEEAALWEHIAGCPDCAQAFEDLSQTVSVLRAQAVRPPVDLSRLVMARIRTGQTDPASFQRREAKKPVSHRLRSWRKVALAACFVAVVAVGAVAGVYGRGARLSGGSGMESAEFLPEAHSDTLYASLPEGGPADAGQTVQVPEEAPAALSGAGQTQDQAQMPAPATENPAPAQDARSMPEPALEQDALPETADSAPADALPSGEEIPAADEAAPADEPAPPEAAADSGIMTIMEPLPTVAAAPVFDAAGQQIGRVGDTDALAALLTGEPWQGDAPAVVYTLDLDGTTYVFGQDDGGALLWQAAGSEGFTRSPAFLADLEALIIEE